MAILASLIEGCGSISRLAVHICTCNKQESSYVTWGLLAGSKPKHNIAHPGHHLSQLWPSGKCFPIKKIKSTYHLLFFWIVSNISQISINIWQLTTSVISVQEHNFWFYETNFQMIYSIHMQTISYNYHYLNLCSIQNHSRSSAVIVPLLWTLLFTSPQCLVHTCKQFHTIVIIWHNFLVALVLLYIL